MSDENLLLEAVNRRADLTAPALLRDVLAEVQQFSANKHFSDDVCLVAMEVERVGTAGEPTVDGGTSRIG